MKAIITLLLVLFIGLAAQAQDAPAQKADVVKMELVSVSQIKVNMEKQEVARLYRRSDSRVKKALNFSTRKDRGVA